MHYKWSVTLVTSSLKISCDIHEWALWWWCQGDGEWKRQPSDSCEISIQRYERGNMNTKCLRLSKKEDQEIWKVRVARGIRTSSSFENGMPVNPWQGDKWDSLIATPSGIMTPANPWVSKNSKKFQGLISNYIQVNFS